MSIDNIPLDCCTVEESMRLMQRSADIVKLRIKKGNTNASAALDESDPAIQTVVYSVELNRKGQPLGITIASTGERGDPVVISQLAPAGLAHRFVSLFKFKYYAIPSKPKSYTNYTNSAFSTGALHVNDRILAINGESIQGKKVAEAMQLLQNASDMVTLKVARSIDPVALMASPTTYGNNASPFVYGHIPQQNWSSSNQQPHSLNLRNMNNGGGNGYHRVQQHQQPSSTMMMSEQMSDRDSGKLGYLRLFRFGI